MFSKGTSIQRKLMRVIMVTSGAVLLLTCLAYFAYEVLTFRQAMVRQLTVLGEIIATNSTAALAFESRSDAEEILAALKAERHIVAASLYDKDGKLFSRYPSDLSVNMFPTAPGDESYRFENFHLVGFQPVVQGNKRLGTLYMKSDYGAMYDRLQLYGGIALLVIAISSLLAYVLSKRLQHGITKPILALTQTAKVISNRGDYSVRVVKLAEDELGVLTDAINQMLSQIEDQNLALSESSARVHAVLNSALSAVILMDAAGLITDWNGRAEEIFGWTREEAVGRSLAETIIPENFRVAHQNGLKHFLKTGEGPVINKLIELSALRKNGSEFPIELSISSLKTGNVLAFCGFVTDITKRKQAEAEILSLNQNLEQKVRERTDQLENNIIQLNESEEQLKKSNELFSKLFNLNPAAILISRLDNAKVVKVNEAFLSFFGFSSSEEVLGKTARELNIVAHPEQREELAQLLKENNVVKDFEINAYTKQGKMFWISTSILIIELENIPCLFSISIDISNRKGIEEQVRAANKELEAFSYSVSHDLRAPLRSIHSYINILYEEYAEKLDEEAKRLINIVMNNSKKMGQLIDDLLAFSRLGRRELTMTAVNMNSVVATIWEDVARLNEGNNLKLMLSNLPDAKADNAAITQVWTNLISNAVKYSRNKEHPIIEIGHFDNEGTTVYFVRDNGAGFDMRYYDKLFGVFQRLHSSKEFEGTGVGLAIVHRIVSRHGGRVWAESKIQEGTTFYFSINGET
ncbi:MAG: PAS domain S-box protein [Bacteroidetes bacterium]|nr:PAS domain S-box protein [Bacteroidota bacterium]